MDKRRKKPRTDVSQLAKFIVDQTTIVQPMNDSGKEIRSTKKNPAAVALGRLGGLKGGQARAQKLSAEKRREIARIAAQKRWASR